MQFGQSLILTLFLGALEVTATTIFLEGRSWNGVDGGSTTMDTDDGNRHNLARGLDGCGNGGLFFIKDYCMDRNRGRAHVYWTNQPGKKYCFRIAKTDSKICEPCDQFGCGICFKEEYREAVCNW